MQVSILFCNLPGNLVRKGSHAPSHVERDGDGVRIGELAGEVSGAKAADREGNGEADDPNHVDQREKTPPLSPRYLARWCAV